MRRSSLAACSSEEEGLELEPESGKGGGGRWVGARRWAARRLPVVRWARGYSRAPALADAVAGVTLGCTLVPQAIAYAALAGLPVQHGLYSAFVGTFLYAFLGTVKEVSIGPTSLMALLTLQVCHGLPIEYVLLLSFLSGCIVLAMGLLKLGFMVELVSPAVTSGFTSGTAVIIVATQLKGLVGVSFLAESLVENLSLLSANIHRARLPDSLLGLGCCALLLTLRKLKDLRVGAKRARLQKALWLVSISRNALVVLGAALLAYCTAPADHFTPHPYFKLSGRVEPGLPSLRVPPLLGLAAGNGTEAVSLAGMARRLAPGLLLTPLVMVLANIAIAKAFSGGERVDATQEMVALGLINMAGSFVGAMPTCGAFTRSAVSHASGVRTPAAGIYSGAITLLALSLLTQYFYYIPRAALSAVLICAVIFMVDISTAVRLWRESKEELCELAVTLVAALLASVELALLCGALASLARLLRALMRPPLRLTGVKTPVGEAYVCSVGPTLVYVSAEHVMARLACYARRAAPRPLLADCRALSLVDHAGHQVVGRMLSKLCAGERVVFFNASAEVARRLRSVPRLDPRALAAPSPAAALAAVSPAVATPSTAPADQHTAVSPLLPADDAA